MNTLIAFGLILSVQTPVEADSPMMTGFYASQEICEAAATQMRWFAKEDVKIACVRLPAALAQK